MLNDLKYCLSMPGGGPQVMRPGMATVRRFDLMVWESFSRPTAANQRKAPPISMAMTGCIRSGMAC